jgi:hypothetical protein
MDRDLTGAGETLPRVRRGARVIALVGMVQIISNIHFLFVNFSDQFLERGISLEQVGVTKGRSVPSIRTLSTTFRICTLPSQATGWRWASRLRR